MDENDASTGGTSGKAGIVGPARKALPLKVVERYLDNCRASLLSLKNALERSDFESARVFGHRLKGTGAAYGFPPLTETGALIECAAMAHNAAQLQNQAAALEAYLQRVVDAEDS